LGLIRSISEETVHLIETNDWRIASKLRAALGNGVFVMTRESMQKVQEAALDRARYDLAILEAIGGTVPKTTGKY
jgi:N-acetylneuraminic acid mutarotase